MQHRCSCGVVIDRHEVVCDDCLMYACKRLGAEDDIRVYEQHNGFDVYKYVWYNAAFIQRERTYNHWQ